MQDYDALDVSLESGILTITLDRPDQLNAVNEQLHEELTTVFRAAADSEARVIVLTGAGKAFSAGGDIEKMHERLDDPAAFRQTLREAQRIIEDVLALEQPLVAKVNGDATGLGATLALFCDVVIASEDARIGDPHVQVALVAGDGGAVIWPLLTSLNKAKELLMTGDLVTATEAAELGLVNHAVPADELDARTDELVESLSTGPQAAIRYTKKTLNAWLELGSTLALGRGLAFEGISQQHPDHAAAVEAFLEGETPEFPSASDSGE